MPMNVSKERTIWVLSELYYPEDSATGYNVTRVAEGLALMYNVRVLCAQPTYSGRGTRAVRDEVHHNVHIHRCMSTAFNKDVIGLRLLNLVSISISIFLNSLWRIGRADLVLVVTNPPTLPFVVYLACKLKGARLVLRVEDVYPDALVAAGMANANSLLARVFDVLQRKLYIGSDRVVVLGRDMMRLVQSKVSNTAPVVLITNFADSDQIRPQAKNENSLLHELDITDKFVAQYSGNMGRTHGLENLLDCAIKLQHDESIHFLFIGSGAKMTWLQHMVRESSLENVTLLPPRPRSELSTSLNACDIALISFAPGMTGVSVPCRMYNIMSAGKPILAVTDHDSELALTVQEERIGWVVPPGNGDLIAEVIKSARSKPQLIAEMSTRSRMTAERRFSREKVIHEYQHLVRDILKGSGLHDQAYFESSI